MKKTARIIIPVFLIIVFSFLTNNIVNQHFHKLSSGQIVKHAHPYNEENSGTPFQKHHHSSSELLFLEQMSNTVFWVCLFFAFMAMLFITAEIQNTPLVIAFKLPDLFFLKNYHAPPETSY